MLTLGPIEARIKWVEDDEPYDIGDVDNSEGHEEEIARYVETYGVFGCVVETRKPACACCGVRVWDVAASLWSIVGDDVYHREIEREMMAEIAAS